MHKIHYTKESEKPKGAEMSTEERNFVTERNIKPQLSSNQRDEVRGI